MGVDWKKVLQIDIPGEIYSKVVRRVNPATQREKNFPVKDEIKAVIRDSNCKSQFLGPGDGDTEVNEWVCNDDDGDTRILGTFVRSLESGKKITKLAIFDVFTKTGDDTNRSLRIKEQLVGNYSGVVKFLNDEETRAKISKEEMDKARGVREMLAGDFKNPEVFDLIANISEDFELELVDVGIMLNRYKWMLPRERHWVAFSFRINDLAVEHNLSKDFIKRIYDKIVGSGVKIE